MSENKTTFTAPSREFLKKLPKTDLHIHLDGSLRLSTIIDIARQHEKEGKDFPSLPTSKDVPPSEWTETLLREEIFKPAYKNLPDYLTGFMYTGACMQTKENCERVAYEFAADCVEDGVYYVEVRFAPQLHASSNFSIRDVLIAVNAGMQKFQHEYNSSLTSSSSSSSSSSTSAPEFQYGIIVCGMKHFNEFYSSYYKQLISVTPTMPKNDRTSLAAVALVHEAVKSRDEDGVNIVALDLAGEESGYPVDMCKEAYVVARENFIQSTVHAGEDYGPESIYSALTDCMASRIGHGFHLFNTEYFPNRDYTLEKRQQYIEKMIRFMSQSHTCLEVCVTSNLQTMPTLDSIKEHKLKDMLEQELQVTICTDNRLVSSTTISNEYASIMEHLEISPAQLRQLVLNGMESSFFFGSCKDKKSYTRSFMRYYDAVCKEYGY